ncbi:MAG: sugar transferase [Ferruginibacter sp.]|nr:sugar transferase [Cytophagales bacterium]
MHSYGFKRTFDLLAGTLLLAATAVVTVPSVLLLAVANRGKVFFVQQRPGYLGRPLWLIKFRTMTDARDATGRPLPDGQRLTKLGKWFRRTSLDELPQLINVLRGDLSLVGPRPLLMEYLPLYSPAQARRHAVKPGLTGWAQVNGRNAISWSARFDCDLWYVDRVSFRVDVQILWLTVGNVLRARGIHSAGSVTMEKFEGAAASGQWAGSNGYSRELLTD